MSGGNRDIIEDRGGCSSHVRWNGAPQLFENFVSPVRSFCYISVPYIHEVHTIAISTYWYLIQVTIGPAPLPTPAPVVLTGPYDGTATVIPGTVEVEEFDYGGEGVAYSDTDRQNNGGVSCMQS